MRMFLLLFTLAAIAPLPAFAACDELVDHILAVQLAPAIEGADCPFPGLDKKGHKLVGVCYQSTGPTSHITIDTALNCHASDESIPAKLFGGKNTPSKTENVTVEAEARGSDCSLVVVQVKPSGELAKLLVPLFDANGKARTALEKGLAQVCKK